MSTYAEEQRAKLDAKIRELRAEGWDVVARRERDLAWSQRDDARDRVDELKEVLSFYADGNNYFQGEWRDKAQRVVAFITLDGGDRARKALKENEDA
jgi:hypothetical protein